MQSMIIQTTVGMESVSDTIDCYNEENYLFSGNREKICLKMQVKNIPPDLHVFNLLTIEI